MAHNATHRRTLTAAEEEPNTKTKNSISMEPNFKKQPKPNPLAYPQDPYVPTNTIRNISNQFSQLYANHKNLTKSSSLKKESFGGGVSYSCVETSLKTKSLAAHASSVFDSSCSALTKSKSQHSSRYAHSHRDPEVDKAIVVQKTADEIKKMSFSHKEKEPQKVIDVKRGFPMSFVRSQEIEKLKGFQEEEGCVDDELKRVSINGGIRRKSFCSSQVELADFFSCSGVKVVSVDMPPFMQIHAVNCARKTRDSLEKFTSKALASTLKKEFDGVYGPAWHCIVGTSFGSFVTHSVGGFIYFSMDHKLYVLLFKTSVQKAESS